MYLDYCIVNRVKCKSILYKTSFYEYEFPREAWELEKATLIMCGIFCLFCVIMAL